MYYILLILKRKELLNKNKNKLAGWFLLSKIYLLPRIIYIGDTLGYSIYEMRKMRFMLLYKMCVRYVSFGQAEAEIASHSPLCQLSEAGGKRFPFVLRKACKNYTFLHLMGYDITCVSDSLYVCVSRKRNTICDTSIVAAEPAMALAQKERR